MSLGIEGVYWTVRALRPRRDPRDDAYLVYHTHVGEKDQVGALVEIFLHGQLRGFVQMMSEGQQGGAGEMGGYSIEPSVPLNGRLGAYMRFSARDA